MKTTAVMTAIALLPSALFAQDVGLRAGEMHAAHHDRDMGYALWYPAAKGAISAPYGGNPVFLPHDVARDATPAKGPFPLVVLSHGLGGHYRSLGWLAHGLAQSGAMVLAVNHPNSTVFDFDMQAGLQHWTRAQDIAVALDSLLADPDLGTLVDLSQVSALGFSYGGWTALSLGGLRGNLGGYIAHCTTDPTQHCNDIARMGSDLDALDESLWNASHQDPRISRVIAIDPGLSFGLSPQDGAALQAPTLLIQLGAGADRLDATDMSANNLPTLLPDADLLEIAPAAHFSVLPLCTPQGVAILEEENDDPVCTDPEGADRAAIHAQVLGAVRAHLGL